MHDTPITLFCAFTRDWAIDRWLSDLNGVDHDPAMVNLCFIVDINDERMARRLYEYGHMLGYRSIQVKTNVDWEPNEFKQSIRRPRIAAVHNQSKAMVKATDGQYVVCLEDDTVFSRLKSFDHLIRPLVDSKNIGFVEGVQMGRWGANMIGAWRTNNFHDPSEMVTLLPPKGWNGHETITSGGWYGYATHKHLYVNCEYEWLPEYPWGPDVNFGLWLKQHGYACLIDWSIVFGHNDHGRIGWPDDPPNGPLTQVKFIKGESGQWGRRDEDFSSS